VFTVSASGGQKPQFLANFDFLGAPVPTPFDRSGPNLMCYSRPMVYAYVPNFVWIALFCRPLLAKTPNFCRFGLWHLVFSPIGNSLTKLNTSALCTTTNLPLPNGIKIVSIPQRFHGEIGRTNSDVQKRDGQKRDGQTKKLNVFWSPRRRMKFEPHQTWHGDREPRARSCTSKSFGGLTHSFARRGR